MTGPRDEFLSEEDLDLRNLDEHELIPYWNLWLEQAQATNDLDEAPLLARCLRARSRGFQGGR